MKNQHTQRLETFSKQAKRENEGKGILKAGLRFSVIAFAFSVIFFMMVSCASHSRPSTSAEIASQMKFQEKWNTEQRDAERKWDSTLKAEQNRTPLENNDIKPLKKP